MRSFLTSTLRATGGQIRTAAAATSYLKGRDLELHYDITLNDILVAACEKTPDKVQAIFQMEGRQITYQEMNEAAEKIAAGLIAIGIAPGSRVAILGPNQANWVITKWAVAKAGMHLVTLNPLYTASELEYAINKVDIAALICPKEIGPLDYHGTIQQLAPDLTKGTRGALNFSNVPTLKSVIYYSMDDDESIDGVFNFEDLYNAGGSTQLETLKNVKIDPKAPCNIQFTSGTTGKPKAAALSHFNLVNNAFSIRENGDYNLNPGEIFMGESSVLCNVLPLYHVFGFTGGNLLSTLTNATALYPAPGFNADATLVALDQFGGSNIIGTPTMLIDLLNHEDLKDYNLSALKFVTLGGSPVSPSLVRQCREVLNSEVSIGYGMTENSCATVMTWNHCPPEVSGGSIGRPLANVETKIVDPATGEDVPPGTVGELCTRGYMLFSGYVKDPEKTAESMLPGNWWKTGDLALLQENGTYKISGRSKDMIIRGGENIQPTEIENYYNEFEGIDDVYVIGVPSKRLGEEVAAYIKLKDETLTVEKVKEMGYEGLARFKVPKYIHFCTDFPKTVTGKVKKFELQKQALTDFPHLKDEQ